ncbi:MAG: YiiX/YebB-like N1pC/P60 family cysteine hydrolase [Planctomycetota bacterium]
MKFLLLTIALLGDPSSAPSPLPAVTVQEIASAVQTGSILASQGDCLAIRAYSMSSYTHVAAVVMQNGQPVVYDTMPGTGVRRLPLADYLMSQRPTDVQLFHPKQAFSATQAAAFEKHLQAQIGRPYDVKHFATGRRCQGLHCSEYLTDALIASRHLVATNPARISPSALVTSLTDHDLYLTGTQHNLPEPPAPPVPVSETWYGRAWQDTKVCSYGCWEQTRRWFCCK